MKLKLLLTFLLTVCCFQPIWADDDKPIEYDITSAGSGVQGTYLVKVYVNSKKKYLVDADLKYAAVHGVLFRGFSGSNGKPGQRPLAGSATVESQHADYFNAFFNKEKAYLRYADVVVGSYERMKMASKKCYKIGAVVQVQKDQLRKDLEKAGVIRGLTNGF